MNDLDAILALTPLDDGRLRAEVPDGWQQGRGAFGGIVVALLARAAGVAAGGPDRPLRSLTAALCGPTQPGPADILVEPLRVGSGVTTVAARLVQAGEVQAHAVIVFGRERDPQAAWIELAPPTPPPWQSVAPAAPEGGPVFARHLEFRPTDAPLFAGADASRTEGWVRLKRPPAVRDAAYLGLLCDAWWPAAFARMTAPRPMATIAYTLQVLGDAAALDPAAPVFHRGRAPANRGGFCVDFRELWSPTGELLALNQQTFAVIR